MAAIATIGGVALTPGVSKNRRWYTRPVIAAAVARAQERLASGGLPLTMMTHHGAEDDSTRIVGHITSVSLAEDGSARFTADIAGTEHGRTIAALVDNTGGDAFLRTVSIRGAWEGKVRRVPGPDGKPCETADALELFGCDMTKEPGVAGAQIDTFAWAADGQNETTERVLITESVEAAVTVTETTGSGTAARPPDALLEALRPVLAPAEAHILDNGLCATCTGLEERKKASKEPYGQVVYADPGYQKDGVKRYPLDTDAHVRSAYSYFSMPKNAAKYTAAQAKRIMGRIKAAMKRIGAKLAPETAGPGGFVIGEAVQIGPEVAEWYGEDPKRSGSWSVSASNGPVNLNLSSYCMDPADLDVILRAAADAACAALQALDPDMDGDIDVPGAGDADTDHDGGHETAPADEGPATEAAEAATTDPAPAGTEEGTEDSVMPETKTSESGAGAQSGLTLETVQKAAGDAAAAAVTAAFEARDQAERDRVAAEARVAAEKEARRTELAETLEALGIEIPAKKQTTGDAAGSGDGGSAGVTEADIEKRISDGITAGVTEAVQALVSDGSIMVRRAGLVEHAAPTVDTAPTGEQLRSMNDDEFMNHLGAAQVEGATTAIPAR